MKIAVTVKLSDFQALMGRVTEAAGRAARTPRPVRTRRIREPRR